jgi:hypothetical protein
MNSAKSKETENEKAVRMRKISLTFDSFSTKPLAIIIG